MARILNIDTSTSICSVALTEDNKTIASRVNDEGKNHALLLASFIDEVLRESKVSPSELSAISVSGGPGSYTGLRIGVSTAKGMAYALSIPLISINTLTLMAKAFMNRLPENPLGPMLLCPMIDARRMEVYSAFYDLNLNLFRETKADIVEEGTYHDILQQHKVVFFGDGATKCRQVIQHPNAGFREGYTFSAADMAELSALKFQNEVFENIAYFEPFYLKDFIPTIPKKKLL